MAADLRGPSRCPACGAWSAGAEITSPAVSIERAADRLTITLAWWTKEQLRGWASLLYLLAFATFLALATRFAILTLESYAFLIPLTLLGYLPALALAFNLSQRMRNQTVIVATRDRLSIRWGPQGRGERDLELEGGVQFYSVDEGGRATVRLMRANGESAPVARQATPAAALQIERALEDFYGWADRAVPGELPRATDFAAKGKAARKGAVLHALAASTLIALFGYLMTRPAVEGLVAEVDLATDGSSRSVAIPASAPRRLEVWVRMELTFEGRLRSRANIFRELPRVFDLRVETPEARLRCDPYEVATVISQSRVEGLSETTVGWFARVDDCDVELSEGAQELKLKVTTRDESHRLERLTVLLREP